MGCPGRDIGVKAAKLSAINNDSEKSMYTYVHVGLNLGGAFFPKGVFFRLKSQLMMRTRMQVFMFHAICRLMQSIECIAQSVDRQIMCQSIEWHMIYRLSG